MKKRLFEVIMAGVLGVALAHSPEEAPELEREIIELPWDFSPAEAAAEPEDEAPQYNTELLARVCMGEAGTEPFIGQVAVVMTIINRCDAWQQTTEDVVYAKNQYYTGYHGEIPQSVRDAVDFAIKNREAFPADMFYFRTCHYHTFGMPYMQIGSHYFSRG